jgi:hypothetical protein
MGAYNLVRYDFVDGVSQYRLFKNPVTIQELRFGEESVRESQRIDRNIERHIRTPYGDFADFKGEHVYMDALEKALRHQRCIISSVNRTKNNVYNYARGNVWEWFITLTFSKEKIDRYDYTACSKAVRQWLNNMRKRYALDLKYLIIPEMHKDGAWHFHGLLSNTGSMVFNKAFNRHTGELLETKRGLQIYNFGNYKYGFSTATAIESTEKASSYVTKYITKEMAVRTKGVRRFYPSNNLQKPKKSYFFSRIVKRWCFLKSMLKRLYIVKT